MLLVVALVIPREKLKDATCFWQVVLPFESSVGRFSRWFYAEFRSAFVHGYPKPEFAWKRGGSGKYFLTDSKNRTILNIDEFVAGFKRGITEFKRCADADPDLRSNFIRYITN